MLLFISENSSKIVNLLTTSSLKSININRINYYLNDKICIVDLNPHLDAFTLIIYFIQNYPISSIIITLNTNFIELNKDLYNASIIKTKINTYYIDNIIYKGIKNITLSSSDITVENYYKIDYNSNQIETLFNLLPQNIILTLLINNNNYDNYLNIFEIINNYLEYDKELSVYNNIKDFVEKISIIYHFTQSQKNNLYNSLILKKNIDFNRLQNYFKNITTTERDKIYKRLLNETF